MSSRFVRFAGSGSDHSDDGDDQQHQQHPQQSRRRSSASSNYTPPDADYDAGRRESHVSYLTDESQQQLQQQQPSSSSFTNRNTAIAANDGPSLAAALAQSIRHHSRMIDGEQGAVKPGVGGVGVGGSGGGARTVKPTYDPYQDDDHVSLAPGIELNYEREAKEENAVAPGGQKERSVVVPALRDYIANAGIEDATKKSASHDVSGASGTGASYDRTIEQQQERIESLHRDETLTSRFARNISNWFGMDMEGHDTTKGGKSVRFAEQDDEAAFAAAIVNGDASGVLMGRAPKFVAPPASTFRTSTRHPSSIPPSDGDNMENRLNAPRRILAARKRHRRNDSFLRLMVAILCFGVSLTFAIIYGEGKFGLAVTNIAYERKVTNRYDTADLTEEQALDMLDKEEIFYPDWWDSEKGIPDMQARDVKFQPTLEYNAADVTTPRAPDRIETPFFWFVPRSGGNVIRAIMRSCLRLAEASEFGAGSNQPFLIIEDIDDRKVVNVDMSTSQGQARAKDLNLAESGVPDVVISGDIHGVLNVFNNRNRARIFAVLRHPLDRAISKYYADLASDPVVAGMTLPQYVRSGGHRVENNYLTRYLSGRYGGKLEVRHLDIAREFLRRKFVVGLASDLPATANLFSHVFRWNSTAASLGLENVDLCYNNIYSALSDKSPPAVEEGSEGWKLLVAQNWFDLKVYEYAEHLFQEQVDELKLTSSNGISEGVLSRR